MEKKRGEGGCRVASEKIMEDSLVIKKNVMKMVAPMLIIIK